jgi:GntR family transcriptional regulator
MLRGAEHLSEPIQSRPLYQQIKTLLIKQIIDGRWTPGQRLPSEFQLGDEFGVSQGTVRKALDVMSREGLLVRYQGKGTYVAEHDPQQSLFRFFHLISDDNKQELPESRILDVGQGKATPAEQALFALEENGRVFRIRRLRFLTGEPVIIETIIVPAWLVRDVAEAQALPNTVYRYYQRERGVTVARTDEKLRAVAATESDAESLGVEPATPLLEIDRNAIDMQGRIVERRISRCKTDHYYYFIPG